MWGFMSGGRGVGVETGAIWMLRLPMLAGLWLGSVFVCRCSRMMMGRSDDIDARNV